ncbi:MAG: NUDIX hydrolase [Oligoflexales bacterium]
MGQSVEKDCSKNNSSLETTGLDCDAKNLIMDSIKALRKDRLDCSMDKIYSAFEEFLQTGQYNGLGGHFTASAVILDERREKMVLTLHAKLGRWLQLGGHVETGESLPEAAYREGIEESGMKVLDKCGSRPFDLDFHMIPERKGEAEHYHFDVTYLFFASRSSSLEISDESLDLKWFSLSEVLKVSSETNLHRIVHQLRRFSDLDNCEFALKLA